MRRLAGLAEQAIADPEAAVRAICAKMKTHAGRNYYTAEPSDRHGFGEGDGESLAAEGIEKHLSELTGFAVKVAVFDYKEEEGEIETEERMSTAEVKTGGKFTASVGGKEIGSGEFSLNGRAPASPATAAYFDRSFGNYLPGDSGEVRTDETVFDYLYIEMEPSEGC